MTRFAIRNAQFVVILILIGILIGAQTLIEMPRSEDPQVEFPSYVILVVYPGTSPEDMETLVVDPLEEVLNELNDIKNLVSTIKQGVAIIQVEADFAIEDYDAKYDEVVREVNSVRPELPANLAVFEVNQIKPSERVSFCMYALHSDNVAYHHLQKLAEDFEGEIENIEGMGNIDIQAYPEREIRIALDYERMAAQNISLAQVIGILQSNNVNIPGGEVNAGLKIFNIQSTKGYKSLEELRETIISAGQNQVVYLRDIAEVKYEYEDLFWTAKYNQRKAILINLKLKQGYNILDVDEKLQAKAKAFADALPPNVDLDIAFEQASAVESRINDFFMNLLQGILLVGLVILLTLGWRSAFIIVTIIPLSIILALTALSASGYGLQQISIASLVIALGLLVDNGIVVIENINRFLKEGLDKREASLKGAQEVSLAIIASTVTTLLSFFPLSQLGEGAGLFLASLPLTVIYTLIISLILALTFSPLMSNWILSNKAAERVSLADKFFNFLSQKIYKPTLQFSLRFGWLIVLLSVGVLIFSVSLFPKIGVSFFPTADKPLLLIDVDAPNGANRDYTERAVQYVENILDTMDYVRDYTSNVGNGAPQIYYNRIPTSFQKNHGQLLVNLKYWDNRRFYETIGQLRLKFADYPGAKITIEELKNGVPVDAPIEIDVIGESLDDIKVMAVKVERIMRATPSVINIVNPIKREQTEIKIALDKEKAGLLNVSELDFDRTVRASLNGLQIDKITTEDDEEYNVVVRMPFDKAPSITDFNRIYIASRTGAQIPLNHIANLTFTSGISEFGHRSLERFVSVHGSLENLDNTIPKTLEIKDELDAMDWPAGVRYRLGGEYEEQQSTFGNLGVILMLAQIGIFAVLVLQFRSILQPIIVFAAIPLAITGSFFALYLTGWSFSFFAFVGLISLIGIVVNNSIILVDVINQLRREGEVLLDAIIIGCTRRFKPIVLTTITTILGLLPLTLQKTGQWSPLCWTIIGGMISSSILTLVVVPILYRWFSGREAT